MERPALQTDVSVIIVNYNTSKLINDCIESIFRLTNGIEYEIIIVDNATEELSETIIYAKDPRIKLLQLPENIGFGRANNEGAKIAKGRNLFLLNPDTVLLNNAIKILSDFLDNNPKCGACGGNLYDMDMNPTLSYRRVMPGFIWELNELLHLIPEKFKFGVNRIFNYTVNPLKVAYITGADLMVKKYIYDIIDGFSSDFFMYYEETDLCKRICNLGQLIYSVPAAQIQHLEGKSFKSSQSIVKINMTEASRVMYYNKNHGVFYIWISNQIYRLFIVSRIIITPDKHQKQYYKQRYNGFKIALNEL